MTDLVNDRCTLWQDVPENRCVWDMGHLSDHRFARPKSPAGTEREQLLIQCRHVPEGYTGALCKRCGNRVRSTLARLLEAIERQGDNVNVDWLAEQIKELSNA